MATVQPPYFVSYCPAPATNIPRTHKGLIPSISTSPWHQSPSDSASQTELSEQMYSILNHSPEMLDYSSSSPTTSYRDCTGDYSGNQSPSLSMGISSFGDLPQQVESSIGPTRGALARKKERLSQTNHLIGQRRRGNSAAQVRRHFAYFRVQSILLYLMYTVVIFSVFSSGVKPSNSEFNFGT